MEAFLQGIHVENPMSESCNCARPDRYVSFEGIDCAGNARQVMAHIERLIAQPGNGSAFWDYFMKKRAGGSGPKPDDLFLIHSNVNQVRELFEACGDADALALLMRLEEECC
jgi:hypothetical protein